MINIVCSKDPKITEDYMELAIVLDSGSVINTTNYGYVSRMDLQDLVQELKEEVYLLELFLNSN